MSKGKRYCSIQKWIEENDKKLYDFLEDNCLLGIFKFRHGTSGVTFLHPKNWKAIEKAIESGDYVDGVNTLKAHVLQGYYPNLDGLMEQHDGLVNALGQLVEVDKKAGNVVVLKNKAKVSESKFVGTPDRQNINVFHYDGDLLPTNAPAGSLKYTSAPSGKKSKSGGGAFTGMNKFSKTKQVEQHALNLIRQGKYESHNPYAAAVVSLYAYLKSNNKTEWVNDLLDVFPEQAYYAIVLPNQPRANHEEDINAWLDATGGIYAGSNPCADYLKVLKLAGLESKGEAEPVAVPPAKMGSMLASLYKGDTDKQRGDEMRWFIALRRSQDPKLFSDPHTFITLVYDLAVLFSSEGKSAWLVDPTNEGSLFCSSRYVGYCFPKKVPSDAMTPAEASSQSQQAIVTSGRLIADDEQAQVNKLVSLADSSNNDGWDHKYDAAKKSLEVLA